MSEAETNELIDVMNVENGGPGFVRSTDTGAYDAHGVAARVVSQGRTSENAWCRDDCDKNPLVRSHFPFQHNTYSSPSDLTMLI